MMKDRRLAGGAWLYARWSAHGPDKSGETLKGIHFLLRKHPVPDAIPPSHIYLLIYHRLISYNLLSSCKSSRAFGSRIICYKLLILRLAFKVIYKLNISIDFFL
jgi:hypothetical protein